MGILVRVMIEGVPSREGYEEMRVRVAREETKKICVFS